MVPWSCGDNYTDSSVYDNAPTPSGARKCGAGVSTAAACTFGAVIMADVGVGGGKPRSTGGELAKTSGILSDPYPVLQRLPCQYYKCCATLGYPISLPSVQHLTPLYLPISWRCLLVPYIGPTAMASQILFLQCYLTTFIRLCASIATGSLRCCCTLSTTLFSMGALFAVALNYSKHYFTSCLFSFC